MKEFPICLLIVFSRERVVAPIDIQLECFKNDKNIYSNGHLSVALAGQSTRFFPELHITLSIAGNEHRSPHCLIFCVLLILERRTFRT